MTPLFNLSHDRPSETLLDQDSARTALDELFTLAGKYNSGAHFVCTARRWRKDYRREIKVSARPIVILRSARTSASCPARLGGSSDFRNMLDHFHCRFILFIHPAQCVDDGISCFRIRRQGVKQIRLQRRENWRV